MMNAVMPMPTSSSAAMPMTGPQEIETPVESAVSRLPLAAAAAVGLKTVAPAGALATGVTGNAFPHAGHLTRLPISSSRTLSDFPHVHVTVMGMRAVPCSGVFRDDSRAAVLSGM